VIPYDMRVPVANTNCYTLSLVTFVKQEFELNFLGAVLNLLNPVKIYLREMALITLNF